MKWKLIAASALAVGAMAFTTAAQEQKVERSKVPDAVLKAVEARYPGATLREFESETVDGKLVYEVALDSKQGHLEVVVSSEGRILVEEQAIGKDALPAAVQRGLASSRYGNAKVVGLERVTESGRPTTFEIVVEHEGVRHELVFSESGRLEKDEPAAAPVPRD